jgi:hypothetical protein
LTEEQEEKKRQAAEESERKRRLRLERNTLRKKQRLRQPEPDRLVSEAAMQRRRLAEAKQQQQREPDDTFDGLPDLMKLEPEGDADEDSADPEWHDPADIAEVLQGGVKSEPVYDASYDVTFDPLKPDLDALCVGGEVGERLD